MELSITSADPKSQLAFLKQSRLSQLIEDKGLYNRICEAAVTLLTSEKLRACDPDSIMGALYKACTLGCRLEPEFGEAYLIPRNMPDGIDANGKRKYKPVCCFQVGYKFWKAKALESGCVEFIQACEVYREDEFSFQKGSGAFLRHIPADETGGDTTHFYAFAKLKSGADVFEVINKQAAEKSRANSETQYDYNNGQKTFSPKPKDVWAKHYSAMALRRPIKLLCAALPLTAVIESAMQADGSISYLQKDGQLVTISPVEVEKQVEHPEDETLLSETENEQLQDLTEQLSRMDQAQVFEYFKGFKKTEWAKKKPFALVALKSVVNAIDTPEMLSTLWKQSVPLEWKAWQECKDIVATRNTNF